MRIRWNQTEEFEVIDQYDEAKDNIDESHNQLFRKGETDEVDITESIGIKNKDDDYVDIQFGNGSIITLLHRSSFTVIDERDSTPEDCEKCDCDHCDIKHCTISGPHEDKFPPKEKPKADFLWPVEKGSVEEAGYEFANARTEDYRYDWWKILLVRASEIEKLRAALGGKHDTVTIQEIRYVAEYEALTQNEQVNYLMFEHSMDEKEAWEYRTDSAYDLPYEIASEFEDFDESKYPDENR